MKKVELTDEEIQIILQCIYACKFDGKHILLVAKILEKINANLE
jgi:hypothetical protein